MMYVLGCSIFSTMANKIHISLLDCLLNMGRIREWDWGSDDLAMLYRYIGEVSRIVS